MSALLLHTTIEAHGPAAAVVLTDEQVASFGAGRAFPVVLTVAGVSFRGRLSRMGGLNLIGLSRAARAHLGVDIGDEVDATVALDTETRTVEVPDDLAAALAAYPAAKRAFDALAYTGRKEIVEALTGAKRPETRRRRLVKALEDLS